MLLTLQSFCAFAIHLDRASSPLVGVHTQMICGQRHLVRPLPLRVRIVTLSSAVDYVTTYPLRYRAVSHLNV